MYGGKRASDDDIIVNVRWELGDLVVDRCIGLGDGDTEKKQRPRIQIHGCGPWYKREAIPVPFYPCRVPIGTAHVSVMETLRTAVNIQRGYIRRRSYRYACEKIARKLWWTRVDADEWEQGPDIGVEREC